MLGESLGIFAREEPLLDEIGRRLEQRTGLPPTHGINFQILSYRNGSGYLAHTDCTANQDLYEARAPVRMASVLIYLTDDFEGGETEFTRLGLRVKPPVGSAVVFYSYDATPACDAKSEHRGVRVDSGHKIVLQRWYSYRRDPLFDIGPWRRPIDLGLRQPWQAVVKCDELPPADQSMPDGVSCRWYNKPSDFVYWPQ